MNSLEERVIMETSMDLALEKFFNNVLDYISTIEKPISV